jgi:hypothetical protein
MIKRLPRFAELQLPTLCARVGALCHEVEEDESGWDFLVELPPRCFAGPADTHPPRQNAYVQVKSAERQRLSCRVKLSNALRAAQSPQPWFVVLVVAGRGNEPVKLYAVHVWDALMRRTLEAVRRAENDRRPLNRSWLTIQFHRADERNESLVSWMQEVIEAVGTHYEQPKRKIYDTAGYEEGHGIGLLTIEGVTGEEVLKNFLGLGSGLSISRFVFTPSRFGIVSSEPMVDALSGVVHIEPSPAASCQIRLRSPRRLEPIILAGKIYAASIPGLPLEQKRVRFSAEFLELLCSPTGKSECSAKLGPHEPTDLLTLENYAILNEWLGTDDIDVQVWSQGKRIIDGVLRGKSDKQWEWDIAARTLRLLRNIAGPAMEDRIRVSIEDLEKASGLKTFYQVVEAGSFRLEFVPLPDAPLRFSSILYWFHVDVGEQVFYALVERNITEDIMIEGKRRVTADKPRRLEDYVLTNAMDDDRKIMNQDYERVAQQDQGAPRLCLGNLRELISALEAERTPRS